ncbi:MAG: arsenic transporter [Candidatus Velthaea sp.]
MTWLIAVLTLGAILVRPFRIGEAVWAVLGAVLLVALRLVSLDSAGNALLRGLDVYCFLIGMMALAEFANGEGVFAWLAARAVAASGNSRTRLFTLVYGVGILTTAFFSNDATIVVLTPAVIDAVARLDVKPLPYLYACALVANAASFLLPISNPSNLLVFANHMPPLAEWLRFLLLPSIAAIGLTFGVLYLVCRRDLAGIARDEGRCDPPAPAWYATLTLLVAAIVLVIVSSLGGPLGYATLGVASIALVVAFIARRSAPMTIVRGMSWAIVPLTAALFVVVAALDRAGALNATRELFTRTSPFLAGWVVGIACNVVNNLPVGLNVGEAIVALHPPVQHAYAALVGVNLGPNFTTNGSLATILWLSILRRANISVTPLGFLQIGLLTTPLALAAALALVR